MNAIPSRAPLARWAPIPTLLQEIRSADPAVDAWPHTARVLPWCVAGLLTMLWLIPFSNIEPPLGLPIDATMDWPLLGAITCLWLAAMAVARSEWRPTFWGTGLHLAVCLFFSLAVASVALNAEVLANLGELSPATKHLLVLGLCVVLFLLVASVVRPEEVPRLVTFMLGLAAITALAAVYEYRFESNPFYDWGSTVLGNMIRVPDDLHSIDYSGRKTVYGSMGHPLELALCMGVGLAFALVRLFEAPDRRAKLRYMALSGLLVAGIFSTERKTGLLGAGAGALVLIAYRPRSVRQLLPVALGIFLILHLLAPGAAGSLKQQLQPDRLTGVNSTTQRQSDYAAVKPDLINKPALGRGFGSYDALKYRVIDNEYLSLLVSVGILGTAAYVLMLLAGARSAHRLARGNDPIKSPVARGAIASLASFAVASALFDVLAFPHVAYLLFFVLGLVVAINRPQPAPAAA